jgi:diadenosine tetraphosphate (Ap4A) HIT family hydrolase
VKDCPFCNLGAGRILLSNGNAVVIRDGFPVSPGHTLIVSRRHVGSFFDMTAEERESLLHLIVEAQKLLATELCPDGWNIGINDGAAAGQTVAHLHVHLIPRYVGDSHDPRGGVRWVLPEKADYWSEHAADGDL